ncbi:unnamed protein product [Eruca vesicaria subsp. sativa]|uniref:Uncharacterized protein n=1 Tax=Eruca vesicaria subsp. sativa TaxID=29727 RepID=A0ABC8IP32_ERUVS|nr:unnamed protein product [Eruca vesicaria subsp. sativa]
MVSRTKGTTTMEVGADDVAVITLISPPVNSLSFDVLYLKSNYEEVLSRNYFKDLNGEPCSALDINNSNMLSGIPNLALTPT